MIQYFVGNLPNTRLGSLQPCVDTKRPDKGDDHLFWQFRGDDHLFWQFCEGFLMTFSDGSFVRHLNIINALVRFFNSCYI